MTSLQEGNFKEIFKTDDGNFVQNEEKLWAKQEILCCKSGNPDTIVENFWMPALLDLYQHFQAEDSRSSWEGMFSMIVLVFVFIVAL